MLCYNSYMKLYYDRRAKDPIYYIQQGFRNGKKTTTKNVTRIGKHSELLKITDDPLAYAKKLIAKYNDEMKNNKVTMEVTIDFDDKIKASNDIISSSNQLNIGYFVLQKIYHELAISSFFKKAIADSKITCDPNLVNRFMTYARILEPDSKLGTYDHLHKYYEKPNFEYVHILRTKQIERAKKLLKYIDTESYKKGPHDVTRFIKRISSSKSTDKRMDLYVVNQGVIDEEEKYDGYYAIATNLEDDAKSIIEISSKRQKIEDCFRVMKTNFSARPIFHQNRERIIAHFMICYTALT